MLHNYTPNVKDKENYNTNKALPTIYHAAFIDSPDPCSQYYVKKNNPNENITINNRKFGNNITYQHSFTKTPAKQSKIISSNKYTSNLDITPDSLTMQYVGDQSTNEISLSSPINDDLLTPIKSNTVIYIHQYDDILTPYINQSKRNTNIDDKSPVHDTAIRKLEEDSPIKGNDDDIIKSDGKTKRHTQKLRDLIKISKEFDSSNDSLDCKNTPTSNTNNKDSKLIDNSNNNSNKLCNTTELYLADEKTISNNIIVPIPPVDDKPNNNIKRFNRKYTCK
mmetsp:Transcript_15499/g.14031  ORF Transcript_15499/g.14031 Transcript_15499/m.14031 type:complete len:279 (-) Transcript_15499:28-864(-)